MEIENRSEILFVYDCKDINPNGDPLDENKPRIDEKTGINIVTDVRLKRTIRDFLERFKNQEIFVKEIEYEPGKIQDCKLRAEDFLEDNGKKIKKGDIEQIVSKEKKDQKGYLEKMKEIINDNILKRCIDVRLFGATIPVEWDDKNKSSITYTGPVQFRMGRSLNKVELKFIKGTGAFASEKEKEQKTFREEYILPYSLIAFYGIINENAAKNTRLKEEDVKLLLEGMWNGTKNLISRSKVGQMPRLLLRVVYKEKNYHIGDLDKKIKLEPSVEEEKVRSVKDFKLNVDELVVALAANKDKIEKVEYCLDPEIVLSKDIIKELTNCKIKVEGLKF